MEAYHPITQAQHAHCPISAQIGQAIFQELFVSLLINMGKNYEVQVQQALYIF